MGKGSEGEIKRQRGERDAELQRRSQKQTEREGRGDKDDEIQR
jgi:hypothetical protein